MHLFRLAIGLLFALWTIGCVGPTGGGGGGNDMGMNLDGGGGGGSDAGVDMGMDPVDQGPPRPCEFPAEVTRRVEATLTEEGWTFNGGVQEWRHSVTVPQTLVQGQLFGVRIVFEGVRPRHQAYLDRHDTNPNDGVDDSISGHSTLTFRATQATPGLTKQPLLYDANLPNGYYRPSIETGDGDIPGVGGFIIGYNNTVNFADFSMNTQVEGVISCAVLWGTALYPPMEQSRTEMDVSWSFAWGLPPSDRDNADGYEPILESL